MRTNSIKWPLLASTIFATCALASSPAWSQAPESADGGAIVVTGSRIARPDLTVSSPVGVVSAEEIALRQPNTVEDILRDMPAVRAASGPGVNSGSDGSATVDLRGVGVNRTLVLLDGRRVVPYDLDGVVDLNTIPTALLERVDVVTGGASSVYGADAVAGVVNFITKRNFSGVDLSGNYRITERGDGQQYRLSALIGTDLDGGRGNAVLSISYDKRVPLLAQSREIGEIPRSAANGLFSGSQNTTPILFTSPNPVQLGLGAGPNGAVLDPKTGTLRLANQGDFYNTNDLTYYSTPLERYNSYAAARYEVTPGIEIYSSANLTRNKVRTAISASGTFQNIYQLPLSNAYLPAGVRGQLCNAFDTNPALQGIQSLTAAQCAAAAVARPGDADYREISIIGQRRFVELGPRIQDIDSTQYQMQFGVRGNLTDSLKYDVFGQYGETSQTMINDNWGSSSKLQQALRSYRDSSGNPACQDMSNGCVPLDLFGVAGSINEAMIDFINLDAQTTRKTTLAAFGGNVDGDLFGLTSPFSEKPVAFSIGAEYRRLTSLARPDAALQIQNEVLGTGARTPPDFGAITVSEVFGEIIAPLIHDKPFFYDLQLEAGLRYSDYNTTGSSTTWKAGGSYEPFRGYKFRGMYQVAVRSPNIQELFQSPVLGLATRQDDPCQAGLPVGNAGLTALCVATGAPASTIGAIPNPSANQVNQTTGGNRNLDVERAKTLTLGIVVTPQQLRGFSVTLDYFNIKIDDAISRPSANDIIDGCFSQTLNSQYSNNAFCQLIQRNPLTGGLNGTGETPGIILASSNLGKIQTAGVDLGVNYTLNLADLGVGGDEPGKIRLGFNGTWLDYYRFQATPNSVNRDCTGYYSTSCGNPRSTFRWNARATYSRDLFDVSLLWQHVSRVEIEPGPNGPRLEPTSFTTVVYNGVTYTNVPANGIYEPYRQIKAYDYFDLSAKVRVNSMFDLSLLVENLFDKQPPAVSGVGVTTPVAYDVFGRTYSLSARLKF